ncbi:hypothetical protein [Rodentibacter caecimuris]|uniref:hypothetical protein n=1 Tax=Rodentibacter caecimuris TaxID=1796644 RepID=UPI0013A0A7B2|nr:hypothetical protein [Rodentibacter heylii]QIA76141.1 hypothetical protein FEE42_01590 [Rodentibacter heylii]QIA76686.1 hypothetical protein FEE42_04600 [Rodentibacter heylii]
MELQKHTKLIDNFINDEHAMSLLFDTYQAMSNNKEDQEKFVLALIGHSVTSHKLLQFKMK